MDLISFMVVLVICAFFSAIIGAVLGAYKGQQTSGCLWGCLLGPIGWIITLLLPDNRPKDVTPAGVDPGTPLMTCWACHGLIPRVAIKCMHCGSDVISPEALAAQNALSAAESSPPPDDSEPGATS